ncbi:hypothetical protein [Pseudomonas sp. Pf153]|uniref:hypothetical protein n=1 Tax=Pseudomonas sp. Pf153 TaxID=1699309 RepID=UPI0012E0E587|nr:hypothetical protein [Pseudomonas sp. Pf153]
MFTTYRVASAGGKISPELHEVQPGATLFLTKHQAAHQEVSADLVALHRLSALAYSETVSTAQKGSKKHGSDGKTDQVQLIRAKQVAPYLIC